MRGLMNPNELKNLLESVARGETGTDAAIERIRSLPFTDLGHTKLDLHRAVRHGAPEVIFCKGKTPEQILTIAQSLLSNGQHLLATRADEKVYEHCRGRIANLHFHPASGVMTNLDLDEATGRGLVLIVSAGTSDLPVAEEALLTARACGSRARLIQDVGVSGLHRILSQVEDLQQASAIVVCAGMEGALPSVVGGLVAAPVIAVPTSVGYGASFGGLAALLGMLNSCANNVTVVNIDNGFGAGYVASLINLRSQSGGREK
jgi:hypothetical protein